ncbi:MAG TPA: PhzF family phenazine biosynthesis protein [Actinopolymorphaceae bacterium]
MDVHVVRVFVDENGRFGNPLGVVLDAQSLGTERRQEIAAELGFSETVFVGDIDRAELRIFTPATELPLAGHPLVGTAWLLAQITGRPPEVLRPVLAAEVATWSEDDTVWVRGRLADAPAWEHIELSTPEDVDRLEVPTGPPHDHTEFWSWIDRGEGVVRARAFASFVGVPEDEATGSAALLLAVIVDREILIRQGRGSVLYARPATDGYAEVGGRVVRDGVRQI